MSTSVLMRITRSVGLTTLAIAALLGASPSMAQTEPPVRYDTDFPSASFHQSRRALVLDELPPDAVAVFFSAPEGEGAYRQDRDLYYLTGSTEPNTVLMLAPSGIDVDGTPHTEVLFVPPRTLYSDVWLGRRFGVEGAEMELGIERAVSNDRFEEILEQVAVEPAVRFFHMRRPNGITRGSDLAEQIEAFDRHARPLAAVVGGTHLREAFFVLGLDAERFSRGQSMLNDRLREMPDDDFGAELFEAFLNADSFADWMQWRSENVDGRFADATSLRSILTELRMIKTDEELDLLRTAIDITALAHREVATALHPGMHEYEVQALLEYIFMREGAEGPGFSTIVGSGENSVILHYSSNRKQMEADDLVVVDIGASYRGYTADVTRTLPVDGTFSDEQRAIYQIVLEAQEAGIEASRAGNSFGAPGQAATMVIAAGLIELGLIDEPQQVRRFFMHGTSHYLGLEVHDVGDYGELAANQVITVEPGIYISPADDIDPRWWNIGVRIEDDVLITVSDPVVLSTDAPKSIEEIEALMMEASTIVTRD